MCWREQDYARWHRSQPGGLKWWEKCHRRRSIRVCNRLAKTLRTHRVCGPDQQKQIAEAPPEGGDVGKVGVGEGCSTGATFVALLSDEGKHFSWAMFILLIVNTTELTCYFSRAQTDADCSQRPRVPGGGTSAALLYWAGRRWVLQRLSTIVSIPISGHDNAQRVRLTHLQCSFAIIKQSSSLHPEFAFRFLALPSLSHRIRSFVTALHYRNCTDASFVSWPADVWHIKTFFRKVC